MTDTDKPDLAERNKEGRPPLEDGRRRKVTSISLTLGLQIKLRRLGGSKWIREQIERATDESTTQPRVAGEPADSLG